jgi:hypothetical protein
VFQVAKQYRPELVRGSVWFVVEKRGFGFAEWNILRSNRSAGQDDVPQQAVGINRKLIGGEQIAVTAIPHLRKWLDVRICGRLYLKVK